MDVHSCGIFSAFFYQQRVVEHRAFAWFQENYINGEAMESFRKEMIETIIKANRVGKVSPTDTHSPIHSSSYNSSLGCR
ncbi:hypothetical protein SCG7086_AP_00010 [Chlamydiales bacterium SCGC AG-110-P3]|nr:hypothetical protein SCG7086_AP_00010 [Chlamydiales bacterium SCGC AG-110-P3]